MLFRFHLELLREAAVAAAEVGSRSSPRTSSFSRVLKLFVKML
jgi:hypothetical protein